MSNTLEVTEDMLKRIVKAAVSEEFENYKHICRLNLDEKEAKEITGHIAGIKALGNGDITSGFNLMQANHIYWAEQRMFNKSVADTAKKIAIGLATGGFLYALWEGFKHYLKEGL